MEAEAEAEGPLCLWALCLCLMAAAARVVGSGPTIPGSLRASSDTVSYGRELSEIVEPMINVIICRPRDVQLAEFAPNRKTIGSSKLT